MNIKQLMIETEGNLTILSKDEDEGILELTIGESFNIEIDDEDLRLLRKYKIKQSVQINIRLLFSITYNKEFEVEFVSMTFSDNGSTLFKTESTADIRDQNFFIRAKDEVLARVCEMEKNGDFDYILNDRYGEDYSKEEAEHVLEIYKATSNMATPDVKHIIQTKYIDTNKLNRTVGSILIKLGYFKNIESEGKEGLDNYGKIFLEVWNSQG